MADPVAIAAVTVAALAALRPEIQSRISRRHLEILLRDNLPTEVGYGPLGPIVGVLGTFYNRRQKTLVEKFRLSITREADKRNMIFSPLLTRERAIVDRMGAESIRGTVWMPPLMDADTATSFDVAFRFEEAGLVLAKDISEFIVGWRHCLANALSQNITALKAPTAEETNAKVQEFAQKLYGAAQGEPFRTSMDQVADAQFPWTAGRYTCELQVQAFGDSRVFKKAFSFSLTSNDESTLRQNIPQVGLRACGLLDSSAPFAFAYPKYEEL